MPFAYMLRCADGSFYVGSTRNLDERLQQHASGRGCAYTSTRLPVVLVWSAEFDSVAEAWRAERRLHSWNKQKRAALAAGDAEALRFWSRPPSQRDVDR